MELSQGRSGLSLDGTSFGQQEPEEADAKELRVVIIDKRALERESLARSLVAQKPALNIATVGSLGEFRELPQGPRTAVILFALGTRRASDQGVRTELSNFVSAAKTIPVIVIADSEAPTEILAALESGARGYIPTSVRVSVAAEAIGLACAGGIFVPASSILELREVIHATSNIPRPFAGMFTPRETGVVEALRQGKPNKIIAYDLNLCESTVKVHIRNIMKKLKATNRTEVAYKIREMDHA